MRIKSVKILTEKYPECDITTLTENFYVHTGVTSFLIHNSPAFICGINPENRKFFISTKSLGNVEPKINYTAEDIQRNHGNAPGLVDKLKLGLQYFPTIIKNGIYQGDFMFDHKSLGELISDAVTYITFKPNTIIYAIPKDSPEGQKVLRAKVGAVIHTQYTGPSLTQLKKTFGASVSSFPKDDNIWMEDANFKDVSGNVLLTDEESNNVRHLTSTIKSAASLTEWNAIPDNIYALISIFCNTLIRQQKFIDDPEESLTDFIKWYLERTNKDIKKLKTVSSKQKKEELRNKIIDDINEHKITYLNIFHITKVLERLKMVFVNKYNAAVKTKQFISSENGDLVATDPEGYVAVDHIGNAVKIINRLEFSRANLTQPKTWK
jgi:hypothetical protein